MQRRGFTLIELLISIAIIGLLSSIVLVSVQQARIKAKEATYKQELTQLRNALELYYAENGRYPRMVPACETHDTQDWAESDCGVQPFMEGFTQFTDFRWLKAPDRLFYTSRGADQGYVGNAGDNYQSYKIYIQRADGGEIVPRTNPFTYCPSSCTSGWCVTEYNNGSGYIDYWEENTFTISNGHASCRY